MSDTIVQSLLQELDRWEHCCKAIGDLRGKPLGDANKPLAVASAFAVLVLETDRILNEVLLVLDDREHCPNCGGKGITYVAIGEEGDEDVSPEACDCSNAVEDLLEQHKERLAKIRSEAQRLSFG